jgi:hypothetical protein
MVAWPSGCTRNIYQIDTIQTIKPKTFSISDCSIRETGTFKTVSVLWARGEKAIWTPKMEQSALDCVDRDAGISTRQVVEQLKSFAHDHLEGTE